MISGGMRSAGKRKNGAIGLLPEAMLTAAMPFSTSALAASNGILVRSLCDQVCEPTVMPAARSLLRISGCQPACSPIGKNIALVH